MNQFPKWKIALVAIVLVAGLAFLAPNFVSQKTADALPDWLPKRQISLGLDLQGGSHILLEVEVETVIKERLEAMVDAARTELRKAQIKYQGLGIERHAISVTILDAARIDEARNLLRGQDAGIATTVEGGRIVLALTEQAMLERRRAAVDQSIEIVRRRIDETGVREPTIQRQGDDRILVQLPGIDDPERIKALLGKTAKMTFHLVDKTANPLDAQAGKVPPGSVLMQSLERGPDNRPRQYVIQKRVMVSGDSLVDSQPSFDQRTNQPIVNFRFDSVGAKRFGEVTAKNVGELFAIVLDGKVISAPVIREPILGGSGQISGSFTVQEAQDLALLLRAGALPAPLTVIEERTVGPGLGADSIRAGTIATMTGAVLVVIFMVLGYGGFGVMANAALIVNLMLLLAAMSVLGATLTLPGIAGIVLTMGMAVDANVLIFERMREETRLGRSPISAINAGFDRAFTTILDSNLTTLIAAFLLYIFGSGPVRGFAVTLSIGIATSMFTAVTFTKLVVLFWYDRTRPKALNV
ncbi:MAG: protein translocase subunit SecD [Magnetospirillum sp. WYHS-4]